MSLLQTADPTLIRAGMLLIPLFTLVTLFYARGFRYFQMVGMLLGMMWNIAYLFLFNIVAIEFGLWEYTASTNMFYGIPVDLIIGWAIIWGALLPYCFEKFSLFLALPLIAIIDWLIMPQFPQLFHLSDHWFLGELMLLVTCLLPSLIIYRLTVNRQHVGWRAFLQSIIWGGWVVFLIPAITLKMLGEDIFSLLHRSDWKVLVFYPAMGLSMALGYWALREFAVKGHGTPIPFDPPQKLVTTGPYAYVANPLQISTVLMFFCLAFVYESSFLISGVIVMFIFTETFVQWHHTIDIEGRLGEHWFEYKKQVRNWLPRLKPYKPSS
jgi:protein-S-isoprenylcysteine O-methyltransferase Ste14